MTISAEQKKDPIEMWADALEGGEYKQGRAKLRDGDRYCCLGVLCELYQKEVGGLKVVASDRPEDSAYSYDGEMTSPPLKVRDWVGLDSRSGSFKGHGNSLMSMNDSGESFHEIARVIRSRPLGLLRDKELVGASSRTTNR